MLPVDPQAGFNFFNATCGSTGRMSWFKIQAGSFASGSKIQPVVPQAKDLIELSHRDTGCFWVGLSLTVTVGQNPSRLNLQVVQKFNLYSLWNHRPVGRHVTSALKIQPVEPQAAFGLDLGWTWTWVGLSLTVTIGQKVKKSKQAQFASGSKSNLCSTGWLVSWFNNPTMLCEWFENPTCGSTACGTTGRLVGFGQVFNLKLL
ncbi:hypothetical protein B0H13DRAFT_1866864 [Mycena leptocephala]|nr:hypothetical protein B0H13DRAFT_1866864 [Mycena leptocephala]